MAEDVTLSAAVRFNQITLQNTADLVARAQRRFSGAASESAATDVQTASPVSRAGDFTQMKQGLEQGIGALSAATDAINGIQSIVRQLRGLVLDAKENGQSGLGGAVDQFNALRQQIDAIAFSARYQGANLVDGSTTTLKISLSVSTTEITAIQGTDLRAGTLGVGQASADGTGSLDDMLGSLGKASATLEAQSQQYGASITMLQMKLDVTVNLQTSGDGESTLSSLTEEGANLLALQTRQQLGTQALSFAGQAEQGVLGLFK